jgi:hypothetical protein
MWRDMVIYVSLRRGPPPNMSPRVSAQVRCISVVCVFAPQMQEGLDAVAFKQGAQRQPADAD